MESNQQEKDQEKLYDFQQYWLLVKRRWLAIAVVSSSVVGLTALNTYRQKPVYQAEGKLLFEVADSTSKVTDLSDRQQQSVASVSNPLDTQAEVIRSNSIVQKTITDLELNDGNGKPLEIENFLGNLNIKNVKGTDVLAVSYKSTNPRQAAAIVNSLMRNYLQNNILTKRSQVRATLNFLNKQLPQVEQRVALAEIGVREFKEENNVVLLEEESRAAVQHLQEISTEITRTQANFADARIRYQELQNLLKLNSSEAVTFSNLSQSSGVEQLLTEYQKVQDELAVEQTRLTDEHPAIVNMLNKQKALKKQLQLRVAEVEGNSQLVSQPNLQLGKLKQTLSEELVKSQTEKLAQANRLAVLQKEFLLYKERLRNLPRLEQKLRQLERRLQVAQLTYQELQKRFQEVLVVENQTIGNARVIDEASVPKKRISPKILLNFLIGGFLGILLGVATAFILEALDKSLKTVEDAKQLFGYPLLGSIPKIGQKTYKSGGEIWQELPVLNSPYSPIGKAFEMLQASLAYTAFEQELKVIVVTSAISGEGRSFVAANLAVAMNQLGRRVLLIEADMRHPRQSEIWKISHQMGLSNVLLGESQLEETAILVMDRLNILTAGTILNNPLALLESQQMATLLREAAKNYDFIIIDSPPLTEGADALVLGQLADGMLLVVHPGIASEAAVTSKSLLGQSKTRVLGMVVNGVTNENSYGGYYSQGYSGARKAKKTEIIS